MMKYQTLQRQHWAADGSVASVWKSSWWLWRRFPQQLWPLSWLLSSHFSKTQWLYCSSGYDSSHFDTSTSKRIFLSVVFHPCARITSWFQVWKCGLTSRVEAPLFFQVFMVMKGFHRYFLPYTLSLPTLLFSHLPAQVYWSSWICAWNHLHHSFSLS